MSIKNLVTIVESIFIAPIFKGAEDGTINIVKPSIVNNGKIDENNFEKCNYDEKFEKFFLKKGDILFQAKGNKFEAVLIDKDYENLISNQIYFNIRVTKEEIIPEYLAWYLNSEEAKLYYDKHTSGATIKSINKKSLEQMDIRVPLLTEQKKLVQLITNFSKEKEKTFEYLIKKEELVNQTILNIVRGGE